VYEICTKPQFRTVSYKQFRTVSHSFVQFDVRACTFKKKVKKEIPSEFDETRNANNKYGEKNRTV